MKQQSVINYFVKFSVDMFFYCCGRQKYWNCENLARYQVHYGVQHEDGRFLEYRVV